MNNKKIIVFTFICSTIVANASFAKTEKKENKLTVKQNKTPKFVRKKIKLGCLKYFINTFLDIWFGVKFFPDEKLIVKDYDQKEQSSDKYKLPKLSRKKETPLGKFILENKQEELIKHGLMPFLNKKDRLQFSLAGLLKSYDKPLQKG